MDPAFCSRQVQSHPSFVFVVNWHLGLPLHVPQLLFAAGILVSDVQRNSVIFAYAPKVENHKEIVSHSRELPKIPVILGFSSQREYRIPSRL